MRTVTTRWSALAAALLALALVAAACGSEGSDTETAADAPAAAPAAVQDDGDDVPAGDEMAGVEHDEGHDHGSDPLEVTWEPVPSLTIEVLEDPKSGWNLHAMPVDFRLAPENVSTDAVDLSVVARMMLNGGVDRVHAG